MCRRRSFSPLFMIRYVILISVLQWNRAQPSLLRLLLVITGFLLIQNAFRLRHVNGKRSRDYSDLASGIIFHKIR